MRGFLAGALALIVLQVLVSNSRATNAVGGVAAGAGQAIQWFLDPNTPAIPDHSSGATTDAATVPSTSSPTPTLKMPTPAGAGPVLSL